MMAMRRVHLGSIYGYNHNKCSYRLKEFREDYELKLGRATTSAETVYAWFMSGADTFYLDQMILSDDIMMPWSLVGRRNVTESLLNYIQEFLPHRSLSHPTCHCISEITKHRKVFYLAGSTWLQFRLVKHLSDVAHMEASFRFMRWPIASDRV